MRITIKKVLVVAAVLVVVGLVVPRSPHPFSPDVLKYLHDHIRGEEAVHKLADLIPAEDNLTTAMVMPLEVAHSPGPQPPPHTNLKTILLWNEFYHIAHVEFGQGHEPFVKADCPVSSCWFTTDRRVAEGDRPLDAVLWHATSFDLSFPPSRSPHTRYVFFSMEPPGIIEQFGFDLQRYKNVFNWTFTYRMDSDVVIPYGQVQKLRHRDTSWEDIDFAAGKTKMVAWVASNCHTQSGRERLVGELRQHVAVDVFGWCGSGSCGASRDWGCYQFLNQHYKFYLALENTLCRDYVTEKLYNILDLNVVPVVYGAAQYSRLLPPMSYIDVLDFTDVKALADYLTYVAAHPHIYNRFFQWKQDYRVVTRWGARARGWCSLCERLHRDAAPSTYPDIHRWFVTDSQCHALYH